MQFKTKQEALNYAAKLYTRKDCMPIMDYSEELNELINDWYVAKDKEKTKIIIEKDNNWKINGLYYYRKLKLFPKEKDRIRIGLAVFITGWHKQYLNWLIHKAKCNSNNYIFREYITKEDLISRNAILREVSKMIFN